MLVAWVGNGHVGKSVLVREVELLLPWRLALRVAQKYFFILCLSGFITDAPSMVYV